MRIFKSRLFARWAGDEGLGDSDLHQAVMEMQQGLIDANLGGNIYKKRLSIRGRGRSGGVRTLIAFKVDDKAFFIYGFAKNRRDNITVVELQALKMYAKELFGYRDDELAHAVITGKLIEVRYDG